MAMDVGYEQERAVEVVVADRTKVEVLDVRRQTRTVAEPI